MWRDACDAHFVVVFVLEILAGFLLKSCAAALCICVCFSCPADCTSDAGCGQGGLCTLGGTCLCEDGYEGKYCEAPAGERQAGE